ncbi:MAG: hypothetical protein IPG88_19925 [Gemmatimonadetes bacterium]|nr:hypothetical protein [Gemmatimonadota bacterium]
MARYILGLGQREPSERTPLSVRPRYLPDSAREASGAIVPAYGIHRQRRQRWLGVTTERSLLLRAPTLSLAEGRCRKGRRCGRLPTFLVIWWRRVGRAPTRDQGHRPDAVGSLLITGVALAPENAGGTRSRSLDSPTGTLLGTTEAFCARKATRLLDTLRLPVPPTPGVRRSLIFPNAGGERTVAVLLSTLHLER